MIKNFRMKTIKLTHRHDPKFNMSVITAVGPNGEEYHVAESNVRDIAKKCLKNDYIKGFPKRIRILWLNYKTPAEVNNFL